MALLPAGVLLTRVFGLFPDLVERFYSSGLDKLAIRLLSTITGIFQFSIAEAIVISLTVLTIYGLIRTIVKLIKGILAYKEITHGALNTLAFISALYFGFILLWGLNYYRLPFADIAHLEVRPASIKELAAVCEAIIERANTLRAKVVEGRDDVMRISGGKSHIFSRAAAGYQKAAAKYPALDGGYGRPKGVILSKIMSYAGVTGVYFPFTGEANVNTLIPDALLPCTICHEMAHQRGFAREDEAEYIAYVTCNANPHLDYQYSGTLLALIRSVEMLGSYDVKEYQRLQKKYSDGVNRDLANISAFWDEYEGWFSTISSDINDIYLKSNRQKEGIYSYNRMVDLLIAEYRGY